MLTASATVQQLGSDTEMAEISGGKNCNYSERWILCANWLRSHEQHT